MRALLLLGLSLVATGCAVGPNYQRPAMATAPAWLEANSAQPSPAAPWWSAFDDPVLDGLEARALAQNLDIEQALARVDQARAALGESTAALLPSGAVDGTVARERQSLNQGFGRLSRYVPGFPRTADEANVSASASWEIDFAGGLRRAREGAAADKAGAEAGVAAARVAVTAEVADAYLALRGAQQSLELLQHRRDLLADQRAIMAARVRAGQAPGQALDSAEARLATADAALAPERAAVAAQTYRLAVLIGQSPSSPLEALSRGPDIPTAPDPAAGVPADILRRRPDVAQAEQRLVAANAGIGAALAEYYPHISLSGLLGVDSNDLASLASERSSVISGAAGLRWRLFDFVRIEAEVKAARGREREALAAYRQSVLNASADVETGFAQLSAARVRLDKLSVQRDAVARARLSAARAFGAGEISRDALLDAEGALTEVDQAMTAAQEDAARAVVACRRALGA